VSTCDDRSEPRVEQSASTASTASTADTEPYRETDPAPAVGRATPLLDSRERVSGRLVFVGDVRLAGMLRGRFLRSPHAHARIVSIDVSRCRALPGVHAVITGKDTARRYGVLPVGQDETAIAIDRVRFVGQEVAAVAAVDDETAERALRAIAVEYEVLPAYLDAQHALDGCGPPIHDDRPRNIEKEYHHVFGDPDEGFRRAEVVVEDTFYHPRVTHAALEPHGTVARYDGGGRFTLWTSTQAPRHVQRGVATALDVAESSVRVIPCAVGGGFGGKSETFPHDVAAALLARITGRPVQFIATREEVFLLHRGRPESHIRMRVGLRADGRIAAVECETIQDGGAFCSYGVVTILYSGALLAAIYDVRDLRFDGYRVVTNKPPCGPMRGHGTIGARHAFEVVLDRAAEALGLDPVTVRERNLLEPGSRTVNDLRVTSYGYPRCLATVVEASRFRDKYRRLPRGRGVGIGSSHYVSGASNAILRGRFPHTTVALRAERDGSVVLFTGAVEIGQGSDTAQAIIVARTLGIAPEQVRVVSGDTALTPVDLGSYASRVTFMAGNAALEAAERLATKLRARVARHLDVPADELELRGERVRSKRDRAVSVSFLEALRLTAEEEGCLQTQGAYWPPPEARGGRFPGAGVGPGVSYSYAAQVAEVEVDEETGEVRVLDVWAAHDCGRALNPLTVRGQIEGSVWMGLAQALTEEQLFNERGQCLNPSLLEYKVPTTLDLPRLHTFIVESDDPEGPFGAKEVGEGSLAAILPAIASAVYDAVGVWINDLPITPEKVLAALAARADAKDGTARAHGASTLRRPPVPHPRVRTTSPEEPDRTPARS